MKKWSSYIASCLPLLALFFLLFSNTASAQSVNQTRVASAQHTASAERALGLLSWCQYTDSTCTGQDPYNTLAPNQSDRCSDYAQLLQTVNITGGTVQIYWSNACGTNWAMTFNSSYNYYIMNANITRADGVRYDGTWYNTHFVYSPMVFAPVLAAQACGSINNWSGGCTGWW